MRELGKKISEADKRGEGLGLSDEEIAFYDALADNQSSVEILGNETLRLMAVELVKIIRQSAGVDWTLRKNIQAKIRVNVKRLLKKYGYPPDKQKLATENILKQAELIFRDVEVRQRKFLYSLLRRDFLVEIITQLDFNIH
ncbi:MAG TPA: type I restriction enzyme endonuclease domain-containing protein [Methanosarcina sp.]|nr:type I restriction enzyme endonuclease domain-containing protein [Methanosarcina sp.]